MQNFVLATPVLSDAAVLSASDSPTTLPVSNLQDRSIGQVWRTLNTGAYVVADLGAAKAINLIALLAHTGTSRSYGRIRAASSEAGLTSTPGYDSGPLPLRSHQSGYDASWAAGVADEGYGALERNHFLKFLTTPQSYRWWRIDIEDPNASFFDAGRLYLSAAWQAQTNMDYGLAEGITDPSLNTRTVSGRISSKRNPKRRWAGWKLSFATEQEMRERAFDIEWARGETDDVLFLPDPDLGPYTQKRTIYGQLKGLEPIVSAYYAIFEKSFRIEEITG